MGWADSYLEKLENGESVSFRPRGNSMSPKIKDGDRVHVSPITDPDSLKKGDIVLCKVHGKQYLHLITATEKFRVQIGNNHGKINGWTHKKLVYGIVTMVESKLEIQWNPLNHNTLLEAIGTIPNQPLTNAWLYKRWQKKEEK